MYFDVKNQLQEIKKRFWLNNNNNENEDFCSASTAKSKTRFSVINPQATIMLTWTHQTVRMQTNLVCVCIYN